MADDELLLPRAPAAKPDDPEDVSWALSTAEAMWTRGEHGESIKWVRKAAEAAADAEDDARALELAKAASDLAASIARVSTRQIVAAPPDATVEVAAVDPILLASATTASPPAVAPAPARPPVPRSMSPMPRPAAVHPSQTFAKPPLPAAGRPPAPGSAPHVSQPSQPSGKPAPPRPFQSSTSTAAQPNAGRGVKPLSVPLGAPAEPQPRVEGDPTMVGNVNDLMNEAARLRADDERRRGDAPAQRIDGDLTGSEVVDSDRTTFFGDASAPVTASAPAAPTPAAPRHDPQITTSQAVRIVVWRDSSGVHVAPAGTVVSAITVDAVLVALEPNTDLTAWLSQR